jgi:hypothetical protein
VSNLRILCVNPLEYGDGIKALFVAHDRLEFPEFFDRAYPAAVRAGAKSWIGVDPGGRLVMHIARFPHRFAMGGDTLVAGILVNLMVAKPHRTLRPAAALLRRVVTDSKDEQDVDFLYADSVPAAAVVLKAVGFSSLGTLERFAFPLGGRRWYTDTLARLYHLVVRTRGWRRGFRAVEYPARGFDTEAFATPPGTASTVRPFRPSDLYGRRLAGFPSATDYWFTIHRNGSSDSPSAAMLVRGFPNQIAKLISLSREPSVPLSGLLPALIGALRGAGYKRLGVSTLFNTEFSRDLRRVGFVARQDVSPILAQSLTARGAVAVRSRNQWEITDLDCDRGEPLGG